MSGRKESAREMDARLKDLVRRMRTAEAEVARALLEMKRRRLHFFLGYSRLQDYAAEELEIGRGKAKELVELAEKLEKLPKIREVFGAGELDWTKCRTIARIATAEDEESWIARARSSTNRALEKLVAEAKGEEAPVRMTIVLTPAEAADIEEAVRVIREERGEAVPLGEAVAEAARRSLGPPENRPGYQVVLHQCPTCESASRASRDGPVEVPPEEVEAAKVDADVLDLTEGGKGKLRRTVTPAERRAVIARDRGQCAVCGSRAWLHIHHLDPKDHDVASLRLLCSSCHKRLVHAGHVTLGAGETEARLRDGTPRRAPAGVT